MGCATLLPANTQNISKPFIMRSKEMNSQSFTGMAAGLLAAVVLLAPIQGNAAESETVVTPSPWVWLEGRRDQISRNVTAVGRGIDDWLAGELVSDQPNESFLRVRLNQQIGSLDGYNSKFKVGGRLDLPTASERWKLIFDSDVDDLSPLGENLLDNTKSDISIGGFRFLQQSALGWDLSHDVGVRARVPLDPFYRFRANYRTQLDERWSLALRQKFWYYDTRGWGYETGLSFDRELSRSSVLRFTSQVKFKDSNNIVEYAQLATLHRSLGDLETLSYELGVLGANEPNIRINNYYVQARYRKAVYENWLILELTPQIMLSRDENWRPESRLLFNIEVLFFDF